MQQFVCPGSIAHRQSLIRKGIITSLWNSASVIFSWTYLEIFNMESHAAPIPNWKIQLILQAYLLKPTFSLDSIRMYQLKFSSFLSLTYMFLSLIRIMKISFKGRGWKSTYRVVYTKHIFNHQLTKQDDLETQLWRVYDIEHWGFCFVLVLFLK